MAAGGSAPDIAGQNVANPIAQILSASLMLRHSFDLADAANAIDNAVAQALSEGIVTADLVMDNSQASVSTTQMGDHICRIIKENHHG